MAMCEDFPCCGHEMGCCPRFDESGRQLDMVCTCGARLPVHNRYSICDRCLRMEEDGCYDDDCDNEEDCDDDDDIDESMDGDHETGLASAGFGTDEDYGSYGDTPMFDDYYGGE